MPWHRGQRVGLRGPTLEVFLMGILRAIVCILLPPLAVIDKGIGSFLIVLVLTLCGWIPGVIGAMVICTRTPG